MTDRDKLVARLLGIVGEAQDAAENALHEIEQEAGRGAVLGVIHDAEASLRAASLMLGRAYIKLDNYPRETLEP